MAARLPRLWNAANGSQDNNNWGDVLNTWLLTAHNIDGTINTTITGVTAGLLTARPASPAVGNIYVATDTNQLFFCAVAGTWREVVELSVAQTLTNKTVNLASNTLSGTTAQFNSALSDGDFVTLAGTETLTNKTVTNPTLTLTSPGGTAYRITVDNNGALLTTVVV